MTPRKSRQEDARSLAEHAGVGDELAGFEAASSHPLEAPAWRCLLLVAAGSLATGILHQAIGGGSAIASWLHAVVSGVAWLAAIRFLLLDTWARRFWMAWLGAAALLILALGSNPLGRDLAIAGSCVFLLVRKYKPYRHLSGSRRARVFILGLLCLILLTLGGSFGPRDVGELPWLHGLGANLGRWANVSVYIFWVLSLLQIFFRMRLHFMRLKPKLGVSALLIALVPLMLVVVFGILLTYGILGGSRAARTRAVLMDWARLTAQGQRLTPTPFPTAFSIRPRAADSGSSEATPDWIDRLVAAVDAGAPPSAHGDASPDSAARPTTTPGAAGQGLSVTFSLPDQAEDVGSLQEALAQVSWTPVDTTAFFRIGGAVWLLRLDQVNTPAFQIDGFKLDEPALDHLSRIIGCDVGLLSTHNVMVGGAESPQTIAAHTDTTRREIDIEGHAGTGRSQSLDGEAADSTAGLWQHRFVFGGGMLETLRLSPRGIERDDVFYHLKIRLAGLAQEFTGQELLFNQAILLAIAVVGVLFLILEGFALYFGVRITAGILSAVQALHRGTVRLAGGDLNTQISVPNEDELGDLASSFNVMTVAVRRGREEAVARERLERELETARGIQQRLLPDEVPSIPGFELTGTSIPSRQVGGDYFDFLSHGDNRIGIAIGDVSGKGIPAALLMSNLQASLQGQVIHPSSVGEVVARVNDLLARSTDPQMFATFFYGVLDCQAAAFTSANAGHNPPILLRAGGEVERLERGGLVLGMFAGQPYEQETIHLAPGDVLVLFTDGISEAEGPEPAVAVDPTGEPVDRGNAEGRWRAGEGQAAGEFAVASPGELAGESTEGATPMFGEERLTEVIKASAEHSVIEIKDAILAAVADFTAGVAQSDDLTLVIIKRQQASSE